MAFICMYNVGKTMLLAAWLFPFPTAQITEKRKTNEDEQTKAGKEPVRRHAFRAVVPARRQAEPNLTYSM